MERGRAEVKRGTPKQLESIQIVFILLIELRLAIKRRVKPI
jgi:hypothetical protein